VSTMAFQELILFVYQGECDRELQRALNMERLDAVSDIRGRRSDVDEALSQIVVRTARQTLFKRLLILPPSGHA